MKLTYIMIITVTLSLFAITGWCDDVSEARALFYRGNTHYSEGMFEKAIQDYEEALESGYESGALYYNLGNAYFKNGSLGKAIANYARARRIRPDDADVKSNLAYAQSLIKGGTLSAKRTWLARLFIRLADSFSLNGITVLSVALYWVLSIFIVVYIIFRGARKICVYGVAPVLIILVICTVLFAVQFHSTVMQKQAVVIAETADAKFEPFDNATTFFALYEGESIVVVKAKDAWIKVRRLDGKQGWIKKADIEIL